jgi:single-strand DNA-binding protein
MASLNRVQLIGRLGKDPEVAYANNGKKYAKFSLAVSNIYTNRNGERQESTEWVNVEAWEKLAEVIGQYTSKGSLVYVEGRLKTDKYEDKSGEVKYFTKVVVSNIQFLSKSEGSPKAPETSAEIPLDDDSIPF